MKINHPEQLEKTNPIQTQYKANSRKAKMNVRLYIIEDYRKNDDFADKKTNPIQTQFKPNFSNFHGALQYDAIELLTAVRLDPVQGSVIATNIISGQQRC